jgi:hypothetical protein
VRDHEEASPLAEFQRKHQATGGCGENQDNAELDASEGGRPPANRPNSAHNEFAEIQAPTPARSRESV